MPYEGDLPEDIFLALCEWLDMEWNRPSRTDNYLMMIGAEVRRLPRTIFGKDPNSIKIQDMKLQFGDSQTPKEPMLDENGNPITAVEMAKAVWKARREAAKSRQGNTQKPKQLPKPPPKSKPLGPGGKEV